MISIRIQSQMINQKYFFPFYLEHFADYYKLRGGIYFVDSLPMTPSGKMLRRKVRELSGNLRNSLKLE